jgi:hypothetical protein
MLALRAQEGSTGALGWERRWRSQRAGTEVEPLSVGYFAQERRRSETRLQCGRRRPVTRVHSVEGSCA